MPGQGDGRADRFAIEHWTTRRGWTAEIRLTELRQTESATGSTSTFSARSDLGAGEQPQRQQRHGHRNSAGDNGGDQQGEHHGPERVGDHHDPAPVEPVGEHPGVEAEHQRRRPAQQGGQRDQERVPGQRGDQQRAGGGRDAVAEIGHQRRHQQPAVRRPEPRRHHTLDPLVHNRRTLRRQRHRPQPISGRRNPNPRPGQPQPPLRVSRFERCSPDPRCQPGTDDRVASGATATANDDCSAASSACSPIWARRSG